MLMCRLVVSLAIVTALVATGGAWAADNARTETLSEGWTFRREGETAERSVRVPHDWGIESASPRRSPSK